MLSRSRHAATAALIALTLAACSDNGDNTTPDNDTTPPPTPTAPTTNDTTAAPTTTEAEPDEPTTSVERFTNSDQEDAVRAAHTFFMVDFYNRDEVADGVEPTIELGKEILTGRQLARNEDSALAAADNDLLIVGPGFDSNIHLIEIYDDGSALVWDCSQARASAFNAEGEQVSRPSDAYNYRQTRLLLEDGSWLIEDFRSGGDECDPAVSSLA